MDTSDTTTTFYVDDAVGTGGVMRAAAPRIARQWMAAETGTDPADWTARPVDDDRARYIAAALATGTWEGWPTGGSPHTTRAFWLALEAAVVPVATAAIPTVHPGLVALDGTQGLYGWQVAA